MTVNRALNDAGLFAVNHMSFDHGYEQNHFSTLARQPSKYAIMKSRNIVLLVISLVVFAGCESAPETKDSELRPGMSRDDIKFYFGTPLRIEAGAAGGEDWYYRFVSWKTNPTQETGTREDSGERTTYVSVALDYSKDDAERPIHVSAEGYVIEPLPEGKIVKRLTK